jgi:hypothetical protein
MDGFKFCFTVMDWLDLGAGGLSPWHKRDLVLFLAYLIQAMPPPFIDGGDLRPKQP